MRWAKTIKSMIFMGIFLLAGANASAHGNFHPQNLPAQDFITGIFSGTESISRTPESRKRAGELSGNTLEKISSGVLRVIRFVPGSTLIVDVAIAGSKIVRSIPMVNTQKRSLAVRVSHKKQNLNKIKRVETPLFILAHPEILPKNMPFSTVFMGRILPAGVSGSRWAFSSTDSWDCNRCVLTEGQSGILSQIWENGEGGSCHSYASTTGLLHSGNAGRHTLPGYFKEESRGGGLLFFPVTQKESCASGDYPAKTAFPNHDTIYNKSVHSVLFSGHFCLSSMPFFS